MFSNQRLSLLAGLGLCLSASVTAQTFPKIDLAVLGPVYLPAANWSFQAFTDAKAKADEVLKQTIASGNNTYGPFDNQDTSFSVSVFSATSDEPLYEYHFEAPGLNGSLTKGKLTENTIYRTGSLGKLLTMYTWMVHLGDSMFDDPITKYIPEFAQAMRSYKSPLLSTNWTEVTIGSLASQISGLGRDFHLGDLAVPAFQVPPVSDTIPAGYPPLGNETVIHCTAYGDEWPTCSRQQFLEGVINHPPVYKSYTTPVYSNIAYAILGLAFQAITGTPMKQAQDDLFRNRLGMTGTSFESPNISTADAIIPYNDSTALFTYDLGVQQPAGGQYVTTKDLRTWGQAILNYAMIPGFVTRRWMKPATLTSQWEALVGAPWEIYRYLVPANSIINASRIVDTYSKSGDVGLYSTYFGLVPDYGLGVTVLTAGANPNRQVPPVRGAIVDIFYNAAEQAAKAQAKTAFTGTFKSSDRNSSITLAVDGGPGVVVKQWTSNSTDMLTNIFLSAFNDFRLYPTDLTTKENGMTYYLYHLNMVPNGGEPAQGDPWPEYSDYWLQIDEDIYNDLSTDAFVIGFDKSGIVQSVECQALRSTMHRAG